MADKKVGGFRGVFPPTEADRKRTKYQRKHDELYWARMKRDFRSCSYHNGGGYISDRPLEFGANVDSFRTQIHLNDAVAEQWAEDNPGSEQEQAQRRRFKNILALRYNDEILCSAKKPLG
jgi:hypothetical protein